MTTPDYVFELEMDVRDYEVDYEGIVNNSVYLNYMEHTRHEFCRHTGLTFEAMHLSGIDPVVRRAEVDYLQPLRSGERFVCRLALERSGARFIFRQDIYRFDDGTLCVRGIITIASIVNGRLSRGDELARAFSAYLSEP